MDSPASSPPLSSVSSKSSSSNDSSPSSKSLEPKYRVQVMQSRILSDVPCKVCQDYSSGKHYGIHCCDGCAGFFKRAIRRTRLGGYVCKNKPVNECVVDKTHRNQCRSCRLRKCISSGMNKDAVQHERGPRNSGRPYDMLMDPLTNMMPRMHPDMLMPHIAGIPFHASMMLPGLPGMPNMPMMNLPLNPPMYPYTPYEHLHPDNYTNIIHPMAYPMMPLTPPKVDLSVPVEQSMSQISESTAKMMFAIVDFVKSQCVELVIHDQKQLLQAAWRELFFINAAEASLVSAFPIVMEALQNKCQERTHFNRTMMQEASLCEVILKRMAGQNITKVEYNCLRSIVLFKPSSTGGGAAGGGINAPYMMANGADPTGLLNARKVSELYKRAELAVRSQIHVERLDGLQDCLNSFGMVSSYTIEEMFFREAIGNSTLVSTITNILEPRN